MSLMVWPSGPLLTRASRMRPLHEQHKETIKVIRMNTENFIVTARKSFVHTPL
jgi:hypothetical protein